MSVSAVADTGPIIHLAEIDSLELLGVLDLVYVPKTVHEELAAGTIPPGMAELSYESVTAGQSNEMDVELDPGEKAALAVAREYDAVLLTDDMSARDAAKEVGVEVHGSLGIIALAHARAPLNRDEAANRMRALQQETSLFVSEAVVERGIDLLDDE